MKIDLAVELDSFSIEKQVDEYLKLFKEKGFEYENYYIWEDRVFIENIKKYSVTCEMCYMQIHPIFSSYYCENCGTELTLRCRRIDSFYCSSKLEGDGYDQYKVKRELEEFDKEIDEKCHKYWCLIADVIGFSTEKRCPYCNEKFIDAEGYYKISAFCHNDKDVERSLEWMKAERDEAKELQATQKLNNLLSKYQTKHNVKNISCNKNLELKEYIETLINVEASIHALKKRLPQLYIQESNIRQLVTRAKYSGLYELKQELENAKTIYSGCVERVNQCDNLIIPFDAPIEPNKPAYAVPNIFNKKKVIEKNSVLEKQYNDAILEYSKQFAEYENRKNQFIAEEKNIAQKELVKAAEAVEKIDRKINSYDTNKDMSLIKQEIKVMIDDEVNKAETLLKQFLDTRQKLYAYNIIFSKYQNLVALTTFYEYLASGRCDRLEGTYGAYNLYEREIRDDLIITQLSQISEDLECIKDSQEMICGLLKSIDNGLGQLNQTMNSALMALNTIEYNSERIAQSNARIEYNTTVTAYYSKMTAHATRALGFLAVLN